MSSLRFKADSADRLAVTFEREGRLVGKRALRHMRRVAKAVLDTSIANSPVDEGNLEAAHRLIERYGNDRRLIATVDVGGVVNGVDVSMYAEYIHSGSWRNLGPRSQEKQDRSPGVLVGKYFLSRALEDHEDDFEPLLEELLEGLLL